MTITGDGIMPHGTHGMVGDGTIGEWVGIIGVGIHGTDQTGEWVGIIGEWVGIHGTDQIGAWVGTIGMEMVFTETTIITTMLMEMVEEVQPTEGQKETRQEIIEEAATL
jgi:hypothetical protein